MGFANLITTVKAKKWDKLPMAMSLEMLEASLRSDYRSSLCRLLILSPRTVPNMSAYRADYLFHAVIGVPGGGGHFHINLYGTCRFSGYHFSA